MATFEQAHSIIEHIVHAIVDHPEAISVTFSGIPPNIAFRIVVAPTEIGKMIGKHGRTAKSLRTIVMGMGRNLEMSFTLDIAEGAECNQIGGTRPNSRGSRYVSVDDF